MSIWTIFSLTFIHFNNIFDNFCPSGQYLDNLENVSGYFTTITLFYRIVLGYLHVSHVLDPLQAQPLHAVLARCVFMNSLPNYVTLLFQDPAAMAATVAVSYPEPGGPDLADYWAEYGLATTFYEEPQHYEGKPDIQYRPVPGFIHIKRQDLNIQIIPSQLLHLLWFIQPHNMRMLD